MKRSQNLNRDLFGDEAIWNILGKQGFVTLLGLDACAHKMYRILGRLP